MASVSENKVLGFLTAGLFLGCLLGLAIFTLKTSPPKEVIEQMKKERMNVKASMDMSKGPDQVAVRKMKEIASTMEADYLELEKIHNTFTFHAPENGQITQEDVEKFILVHGYWVSEFKKFKRNYIGKSPGLYRSVQLYFMMGGWAQLKAMESYVKNQVSENEFEWIKTSIMAAALYCVRYKLQNERLTEAEIRRLEDIQHQLFLLTNIIEWHDGVEEEHFERLPLLDQVPRSNIEMFLDNYTRIHYHKVHFTRPTLIEFDREAILAAAAGNPP